MLGAAHPSERHADAQETAWPFRYPAGESTQQIRGHKVTLYVPRRASKASKLSLLVLLHGARAQGSRLATFFRYWPTQGLRRLCAAGAWPRVDAEGPRECAAASFAIFTRRYPSCPIGGTSPASPTAHPTWHHIAFADDMKARSGTWVGGGFTGATVPGWARHELRCALDGGRERLRSLACRAEVWDGFAAGCARFVITSSPTSAHTWPTSMIGYHVWWMGVQEGRYVPGVDENFDWDDDLDGAMLAVESRAITGRARLLDSIPKTDGRKPGASRVQNAVLIDERVREAARGYGTIKLDINEASDRALKSLPP